MYRSSRLALADSIECRAYAEKLRRTAEETVDPKTAAIWRLIAAQWDALATEFERLGVVSKKVIQPAPRRVAADTGVRPG